MWMMKSPRKPEGCHMKRQPEREHLSEHLNRWTVKTLDQVFVTWAEEGPGSSQFEAEALTNFVKGVYFPRLSQPPMRLLATSVHPLSSSVAAACTPWCRIPTSGISGAACLRPWNAVVGIFRRYHSNAPFR
jgi:hypothetical protein